MASESDSDEDADALFATARELLGSVAGEETAQEFEDAVNERIGTENVTEAVMGGLAAGEQINQMRQQSRRLQAQDTQGPPFAVQTRTVVDNETAEYVGTAIYVDDPEVEFFESDDSLLLRGGGGETTVSIPQGIGEVETDREKGVLTIMVHTPGYDAAAGRRLVSADEADSAEHCKLCFELSSQPKGPDTCSQHGEAPDLPAEPSGSEVQTTDAERENDDTAPEQDTDAESEDAEDDDAE